MTPTRVTTWDGAAHDAVRRIATASEAVDGQSPLNEAAVRLLDRHGLEDAALWLADADGYALLHGEDLDVAVAPAARRHGTGAALVESALAEAGPVVDAWSHGNHPAAAVLAERFGFTRVRDLWVLRRGTSALPDAPPPAGFEIRTFRAGDEAELLRVNAEAFAHHPEQGAMDRADLAERMAEPWFDPDGLLVADTGQGLLGFHWTKQHSAELGEVYVVAVDPAAQGRGLGNAVTAAGLAHLTSHGVRRIILYVESDNEAAIATYSKLGFAHTS
ncbi:MAG: mycothiol synthase, partial [Nocardioidaceae bacterium]|nr:mycothiol synthase [Nocardioidaceae bacterium]